MFVPFIFILFITCRYEDLKTQLQAAQEAALAEDDEAELRRATAAVARLTAPSASVSELELNAVEDMAGTIKINGKPIEAKKVCTDSHS